MKTVEQELDEIIENAIRIHRNESHQSHPYENTNRKSNS